MVEVSILGISLQNNDKTPVLLLFPHASRNILSLKIGALEAFSISAALEASSVAANEAEQPDTGGVDKETENNIDNAELFSRPLIHQLLQRSIHTLGGNLISVNIGEDNTGKLNAKLLLQGHSGEEELDCRPADGIALALRCGAAVRISPELASKAEDIETVLPSLSEELRILVAAKLLALPRQKSLALLRESLLLSTLKKVRGSIRNSMVEVSRQIIKQTRAGASLAKALSETAAKISPQQQSVTIGKTLPPSQEIPAERRFTATMTRPAPPAVRTDVEEVAGKESGDENAPAIVDAVIEPGQTIVLPGPRMEGKGPTIRISLVRQPVEGKTGQLDAFLFPSLGIAKEALGSLSLSRDDVKHLGKAVSEDDRLHTLLRILAPETKVPM